MGRKYLGRLPWETTLSSDLEDRWAKGREWTGMLPGKRHMCGSKEHGEVREMGVAVYPQTGSPGHSGQGQGRLWGTAGPGTLQPLIARSSHRADPKTRWGV